MSRTQRLLACIALAAAGGWLQAAPVPEQELVFRVLLDDREIGYHRFVVTRQGERQIVDIDARFRVSFLGIPVYRYDHRNRETWQQGCLESIGTITNDDGDQYEVEGRDRGEQFDVTTLDGTFRIEAGCVMTFAYWDRDFLRQAKLLNSQNGEYLAIEVVAEGVDELRVKDRAVSASRHRLVNAELGIDIAVWHAVDDGRWLSLESRVEGGRVVRYRLTDAEEIESLPPRPQDHGTAGGDATSRESGNPLAARGA